MGLLLRVGQRVAGFVVGLALLSMLAAAAAVLAFCISIGLAAHLAREEFLYWWNGEGKSPPPVAGDRLEP